MIPFIFQGMRNTLSRLFPSLSVSLLRKDLSKDCFDSFQKIHPYEDPERDRKVMDAENVYIDHFPIVVPWFKGVKDQLRRKEFAFKDK